MDTVFQGSAANYKNLAIDRGRVSGKVTISWSWLLLQKFCQLFKLRQDRVKIWCLTIDHFLQHYGIIFPKLRLRRRRWNDLETYYRHLVIVDSPHADVVPPVLYDGFEQRWIGKDLGMYPLLFQPDDVDQVPRLPLSDLDLVRLFAREFSCSSRIFSISVFTGTTARTVKGCSVYEVTWM